MSEAIFQQVVIAEHQLPSLVAHFRDDKTPYNSELLSGDGGRNEEVGK